MRTLTARELDEIFAGAGQSEVSATMNPVTVTAQQISTTNFGFPYASGGGGGFAGPTYSETGTACYANAGLYYALNWYQHPDLKDLRCEVNAAADSGFGIPATTSLMFVNDYAFKNRTTKSIVHQPNNSWPSNSDPLYGQSSAAHNHIFIYAHGVLPSSGTTPYTEPYTGISFPSWVTNFTALETQILTMAHEAAHGHGIVDEALAEGYGIDAVKRFRRQGAKCP